MGQLCITKKKHNNTKFLKHAPNKYKHGPNTWADLVEAFKNMNLTSVTIVIYINEHALSKKINLGFFCMLDWCPSSQGVFLKHGQLPMTCKMSSIHKSKFNLCLDMCNACPCLLKMSHNIMLGPFEMIHSSSLVWCVEFRWNMATTWLGET